MNDKDNPVVITWCNQWRNQGKWFKHLGCTAERKTNFDITPVWNYRLKRKWWQFIRKLPESGSVEQTIRHRCFRLPGIEHEISCELRGVLCGWGTILESNVNISISSYVTTPFKYSSSQTQSVVLKSTQRLWSSSTNMYSNSFYTNYWNCVRIYIFFVGKVSFFLVDFFLLIFLF